MSAGAVKLLRALVRRGLDPSAVAAAASLITALDSSGGLVDEQGSEA